MLFFKGMTFRYEYLNGVWIDLEQPDETEIRQVAKELNINERLERELLSPTPISTVAGNDDMALLVLHFPTHGVEEGKTKSQEIDFIVGKNFILTVRYEIVAPLHHLKKLLETEQLVGGKIQITTDVLIEILFAHLYTAMRDHVSHIADKLSRVERDMFDGRERSTVTAISNVSREFLHFEASVANQEGSLRHFLASLERNNYFGPSFSSRVVRILDERDHVERVIRTHRAVASEMRETNIAMLEVRQNEIIKTLTVVNFIFLPLGLISWVFAMRTEGMPLIASEHSFWIVMGGMAVVALLLFLFVARKRWL